MHNISTTVDNLIIKRIVSTAAENAENVIGHADPIGEQGVKGVPIGPKVHAGDPGPDPFKLKFSLGDKDYITFHLNGTIKSEVE